MTKGSHTGFDKKKKSSEKKQQANHVQRVDVRLATVEKRLLRLLGRLTRWPEEIRNAISQSMSGITEAREALHKLPDGYRPTGNKAPSVEPGTMVRIRDKRRKMYEDLLPPDETLRVVAQKGSRLVLETSEGKVFVPRGHVEIVQN